MRGMNMELLFDWKKGWLETKDNSHPEVSQLVEFRLIPADKAQVLADSRDYADTGLDKTPITDMMAKLLHVDRQELSNGTLMLGTPETLGKGKTVEIRINVPVYRCTLRFLAETLRVDESSEMKERVFSAGLHIEAANKRDVGNLEHLVETHKAGSA